MPSRLSQRPPPFSKLLRNHFRDLLKGDPLSPRPALAHSAPQRSRLGVTGHFKMHHLGSNQSAPPLRRGFCRLVGLVGQAGVLGRRWAGDWAAASICPPQRRGLGKRGSPSFKRFRRRRTPPAWHAPPRRAERWLASAGWSAPFTTGDRISLLPKFLPIIPCQCQG